MKVVGIRHLDFTGGDGKAVKGTQFFLSEPMDAPAEGVSTMKAWVKPDDLKVMGFMPKLGDNVEPVYNKYGKPYSLRRLP